MKLKWYVKVISLALFPYCFLGEVATAQGDSSCFMQSSSGQQIPLDSLCGKSIKPNGNVFKLIRYEKGKRTLLPNGDAFEADGSITKKSGIRIKPILKDGRFVGVKFYGPDGKELKKGRGKLSNGESFRIR